MLSALGKHAENHNKSVTYLKHRGASNFWRVTLFEMRVNQKNGSKKEKKQKRKKTFDGVPKGVRLRVLKQGCLRVPKRSEKS